MLRCLIRSRLPCPFGVCFLFSSGIGGRCRPRQSLPLPQLRAGREREWDTSSVVFATTLIACEYEEIWAPGLNDFISMAWNSGTSLSSFHALLVRFRSPRPREATRRFLQHSGSVSWIGWMMVRHQWKRTVETPRWARRWPYWFFRCSTHLWDQHPR